MPTPPIQTAQEPNIHVRVITEISRPELNFLRFQVGRWEEEYLCLSAIPHIRREINEPVRRFRLLGFGKTREAAFAMAGLPDITPEDDTDPLNQLN